jgi:hypothetical protein
MEYLGGGQRHKNQIISEWKVLPEEKQDPVICIFFPFLFYSFNKYSFSIYSASIIDKRNATMTTKQLMDSVLQVLSDGRNHLIIN